MQSLNSSLERFITAIQDYTMSTQGLQKEVTIITQILKIAKGLDKQESNICDEDLFFKIVNVVSKLIDQS
jgi:hypothetical protein